MRTEVSSILLALTCLLVATTAVADDLTVPNTFQAGTPARAADVNDNFTAVEASVDDNAATITAFTAQITALTVQIETMSAQLIDVGDRLVAAELLLTNTADLDLLYAELDNKITAGEPICSTKVAGRGMYLRDAATGAMTTNVIKYTYDGPVDNAFLLVYTIDLANNYNRQIELVLRSNWATSTGGLFDAACIIP